MNLHTLVESLLNDTLETSLPLFRPELVLCATIVLMLVVRVFPGGSRLPSFVLALGGSILALLLALPTEGLAAWSELQRQELFTGMLVHDTLTAYIRLFLMAFAVLFIVLSELTGIADREDGQDYYALVLGATVGMCVMASANHLLTVFLGVEMASVPSYVLSGVVKGRRRSSEAALKYAVYGAGTAGVMLYGVSLLAGVLGSAHLPTMAAKLSALDILSMIAAGEEGSKLMVLALGGLMLGVGLAFKLSAVPFHFWCPDVFEGASAEVDAFLSVASKAAALALLLRVGLGLTHVTPEPQEAVALAPAATKLVASNESPVTQRTAMKPVALVAEQADSEAEPLSPVRKFVVTIIAIVAMVTCTFGNLAAYGQTNIKRMLGYSTIAHAGYMMMAVAAAIALVGSDITQAHSAVSALLLYVTIYLFMNLSAFAIIAFLRNAMQSEEIEDYAGLVRSAPVIAVMMTAVLVSLIGLPPLAGFWPKLRVLQSLYEAGGTLMITALIVAGLNTAISLIYYLRVAKTMCIDPEPDSRGPVSLGFLPVAYVLVVSLPVLILGLLPEWVARWADAAAQQFFV
ncbi:MAG: NADH-quinone oxidoreductase subunit N [Planctomycetota bacterium]